jgi:trehalose-6-phosphate synthase
VPIHYLYTTLAQRELFAHYVAADVALVTPLRDGMNLVAHEFVASRTGDDGVLILSELAGAAEYLPDAILVNPYDIREVADAIAEAFQMDVRARKRRMRRLRASVRQLDVHAWADDWVRKLEQGAR